MARDSSRYDDAQGREPLMHALTEPMQRDRASGSGLSLGLRLLLYMLRGLRVGSLVVELPDGSRRDFEGGIPGPHGVLQVRRPDLVSHVMRCGEVGFGEAYMAGCWDSPDLTALLCVLYRNEPYFRGPYDKNLLGRMAGFLQHRLRLSKARARDNIAHHYDLGNSFYRQWLDGTMAYSSAVFAAPNQSLEAAQVEKFRRLAERLALGPEHHMLEIGCGWGGFAIWCAQRYGCRVTGLTLSTEQLAEAQARAETAGVADRVSFRLEDYRDHRGVYDRIASIEMYEAVGERHWPGYFQAVHDALVPGGRAAVQGITIAPEIFESYRRKRDFIQKHIFPGGMLCPPERFRALAADAGLESRDARFYAGDYARTLAIWHRNILACADRVTEQFDARFLRMWRYYLAYCECGFLTGSIDLMQITLLRRA
jgi:cyclopropane-fatty-acyl-phospholipid synthase